MFDVADIIVLDMLVNGRRSTAGVIPQAASTPSPRMPWTLGRGLYWLAFSAVSATAGFLVCGMHGMPVWLGVMLAFELWIVGMTIDDYRSQKWSDREQLLREEQRRAEQEEAAAAYRQAQEDLKRLRENDSSWISRIPSGY